MTDQRKGTTMTDTDTDGKTKLSWQYLRDDCEDLTGYLPELRKNLAPSSSARGDGGGGKPGKISGSPAPWAVPVAALLTDVHAGVRRLEAELRTAGGLPARRRGGSDANTAASLTSLADLAALVGRDDGTVSTMPRQAARQVYTWCRRARVLLDEQRASEQPWSKVPDLFCPNPSGVLDDDGQQEVDAAGEAVRCDRPLWLEPGWRHVQDPPIFCRSCRNPEGGLYSWPSGAWMGVLLHRDEVS